MKSHGRIKDHELVICGQDQSDGVIKTKILAAKKHDVTYVEDVSDAMLDALYDQSDFTLYPSLDEGWGLPIQESVARNKVCLASADCPAAQEIHSPFVIRIPPTQFFAWAGLIETYTKAEHLRNIVVTETEPRSCVKDDEIGLSMAPSTKEEHVSINE